MSIKLEEMMNEFRYPSSINTDKDITTSGTITASNISTLTTGSAGAFTVNGALTVTAASTHVGNSVFVGTITATGSSGSIYLGSGGPSISIVNFTGAASVPDIIAPTGSIAVNLSGTGPASRMFISKGGSAWTNLVAGA
jgi:hypothetical protein